jgi:hypothetical protein
VKKIFLALFFVGFGISLAHAQTVKTTDDEDIQSWNDVQLTVPVTKEFDFYAAVTARFGKNLSRLNDRRLAVGFIYKANKSWSFQPFYWNIRARNTSGKFGIEHRLNLRVGYRFPFKKIGLSHRSLFERRLRSPRNSWRYRPSLTFEKDIPKKFIPKAKLFVIEEVFYDSILKKFSRNRFSVGVTRTLTRQLSLDVYYMRQNDGFSRPGNLNVIGTSFKVRL